MKRITAARRLVIGRAITLLSAFTYCIFRASHAWFVADGGEVSRAAQLLSGNGKLLWVWVIAWAGAAIWCLVDLYQGHTRKGLPIAVGLAMAWGSAHLIEWSLSGFSSGAWIPAMVSIAPCLIIFGLLIKVSALHEIVGQAVKTVAPPPPTEQPGG